jgi:D-glycero-D-manno-heptose 1,7-bisphosphate phosphatase
MISSRGERGAVFIDRDGVICENRDDHVKSWSEFNFIPGSVEALAALSRARMPLYIVTNQAIIGRGMVSRRNLDVIHEKMIDVFHGSGVKIESVLVCPHHPDDKCPCRKPEPGLLTDVAFRNKISLQRSFMIGDSLTDVEAGARAGCTTILVRTGRGGAAIPGIDGAEFRPDFVADDLVDAAIWVLAQNALRIGSEVRLR